MFCKRNEIKNNIRLEIDNKIRGKYLYQYATDEKTKRFLAEKILTTSICTGNVNALKTVIKDYPDLVNKGI